MENNPAPNESLQDDIISQTLKRLQGRQEFPAEIADALESALRGAKAPKPSDLIGLLTEPIEATDED